MSHKLGYEIEVQLSLGHEDRQHGVALFFDYCPNTAQAASAFEEMHLEMAGLGDESFARKLGELTKLAKAIAANDPKQMIGGATSTLFLEGRLIGYMKSNEIWLFT